MLSLPPLICNLTSYVSEKNINLPKRTALSSNPQIRPMSAPKCCSFLLQQAPLSWLKASPSLCSAFHVLFAFLGPHSLFCFISFTLSPEFLPSVYYPYLSPYKNSFFCPHPLAALAPVCVSVQGRSSELSLQAASNFYIYSVTYPSAISSLPLCSDTCCQIQGKAPCHHFTDLSAACDLG